MKKWIGFIGALALSAASVHAVTVIDTSILKAGNTWVYSLSEESRSGGVVSDGFTGSVHFKIDSLVVVQDSVRFKVTRRQVGQLSVWIVGGSRDMDTTQSSYFTFKTGSYSPAVPFFATEQSFNDTDGQVIYRGDTLRVKTFSNSGPGVACLATGTVNIQGIGRVTDNYTVTGCGTSSGHKNYQLTEFNGQAYRADSVHPVSIRAAVRKELKIMPQSSLRKNKVVFKAQGFLFDTKGRKAAGVAPVK